MRTWLPALAVPLALALAGCGKDDAPAAAAGGSGSAAAPSPVRGGADPDGPCTWIADGKCMEHEALFAEAIAKPTQVALTAPYTAGPLAPTDKLFLQIDARRRPFTLTVTLNAPLPAGGARFRVRRWESRVDGWLVGEDAFNTAVPGAVIKHRIQPETEGPQLIAIVGDAPLAFSVAVRAE
jgi:hypothetical protein